MHMCHSVPQMQHTGHPTEGVGGKRGIHGQPLWRPLHHRSTAKIPHHYGAAHNHYYHRVTQCTPAKATHAVRGKKGLSVGANYVAEIGQGEIGG